MSDPVLVDARAAELAGVFGEQADRALSRAEFYSEVGREYVWRAYWWAIAAGHYGNQALGPVAEVVSYPLSLLGYPTVGALPIWCLSEAQVQEWQALYPSLDVLAEARKALAWVRASPTHRKTAAGMPRLLVGWLNRANDRGGASRAVPTDQPKLSEKSQRIVDTDDVVLGHFRAKGE